MASADTSPAQSGAASPAPAGSPRHPLLAGAAGPLYAFALPQELLQVIALRSPLGGHASTTTGEASEESASSSSKKTAAGDDGTAKSRISALGCNLCGADTFDDIAEQRSHFTTDWHRYNVKRRLANKSTVGEQEWEGLVEALSDSLTGSASESSEGSTSDAGSEDETKVARVLAKQKISNNDAPSDTEDIDIASPRSPLLWFEANSLIADTQFGIYRTIFPSAVKKATEVPWLDDLRSLQVTEDTSKRGWKHQKGPATDATSRTWTLLAVGGGHFAGMIVSLVPKVQARNGRVEREVQVLQSKTFHRYTTRRKQGGAQSANDAAKGNAKSAGAQIRRYNEAMLRDEIRALLESWKEDVKKSELIFVRASKTSQKIFYDYEDAVLEKKDSRMRTFPFPTRRPTQAELVRCFTELTRVKLSHLTAAELQELDDAYRAAMQPKPKPAPKVSEKEKEVKPEVPKLSREEAVERDKWERVVDMVKKGRLEALKGFLERQRAADATAYADNQAASNGSGPSEKWIGRLPSWMEEAKSSPTLLHVAASNDQPDVTRYLLLDLHVNPTLSAFVDSSSSATETPSSTLPPRTAYECASSRNVRNVFRRAYADFPTLWNWEDDARVPSALTEEQETLQNAKKTERKNKLKDKLKERQAERDAELAAQEEIARLEKEKVEKRKEEERRMSSSTAPRRLGGNGTAPQKVLEQTQLRGLSEEAKMRIERERRAKAAEARLQQRPSS